MNFEPLLPREKKELPSTTINAFGAHLWNVLNEDPREDDKLCIFSSWLGPLATGELKDGGIEGSFNEHVIVAVNIFQT